ncbi:MAG: type VI-D CRISPR-associated RNA-guided ribonuclease Cas13d [Clostridia bacterium]|nr:type VI-D CRISPR-associated RNA-guided ribonuclease Cas13d [Clostridia bacterium]
MAAKKKESQKERRLREKQERNNKSKAAEKKRNEEKAKASAKVQTASELISRPKVKVKKKSLAKANGLKSMFVVDDNLYLTSFGSKNESLLETKFSNGEQIRIATPDRSNIDAEEEKTTVLVKSTKYVASKPGHATKINAVRQDLIGAKASIEKRFFENDTEYQDNIHIQLAYNILDIEKILAEYIDNIIYCINNVSGINSGIVDGKPADLIGDYSVDRRIKFDDGKPKDEKFQQFISSGRLGYFGNAFYHNEYDKKKSSKDKKVTSLRTQEEIAMIIELLGSLRQFLKHGKGEKKYNAWLYLLDKTSNDLPDGHKKILDEMYSERVDSVNEGFIETNKKSLLVLFKALNLNTDEEKKKCAQDYYRFIVTKDARNIGFSVKQLREVIVDKRLPFLRDKDFDGARSLINKWLDFVIYRYCLSEDGKELVESFVNVLRSSVSDEEKDRSYLDYADKFYRKVETNYKSVFENIKSGKDIGKIDGKLSGKEANDWIEDIRVKAENTSYFTKLMYMLTLFIDGKEINILLTSLINKFENIQSFIDIMESLDLDLFKAAEKKQVRDYTFFHMSNEIAEQLRTVKSFARMDAPLHIVEWPLYQDALRVLGLESDELDKYKSVIFTPRVEGNEVQRNDTNLRNFIKNNVINSSRFQYLIRFTNIDQIREFAKNRKVVEFVLKQIPKTQIERYFDACMMDTRDRSRMVADLSLELVNFSFNSNDVGSVKQKSRSYNEQRHKETLVSIIGLYLTVLYLIAKNLVNINARYTIAIHSLERDSRFVIDESIDKAGYFGMVDHYIECQLQREQERRAANKRFNKRALNYITSNRDKMVANKELGELLFREYRNAIAHLTAVTNAAKYAKEIKYINSYFDIYHFAMQRYLLDLPHVSSAVVEDDAMKKLFDDLRLFGTYQKDLVWLLNVPFAYNLPRYKSLSIADLFKKEMQPVSFEEN